MLKAYYDYNSRLLTAQESSEITETFEVEPATIQTTRKGNKVISTVEISPAVMDTRPKTVWGPPKAVEAPAVRFGGLKQAVGEQVPATGCRLMVEHGYRSGCGPSGKLGYLHAETVTEMEGFDPAAFPDQGWVRIKFDGYAWIRTDTWSQVEHASELVVMGRTIYGRLA